MSDISRLLPQRRTVEFRGEKYTPYGALITQQAVLEAARAAAQSVLEAFPLEVIGSGRLEHAIENLGTVVDEFDRVAQAVMLVRHGDTSGDRDECEHEYQWHPQSEDFGVCAVCGAESPDTGDCGCGARHWSCDSGSA